MTEQADLCKRASIGRRLMESRIKREEKREAREHAKGSALTLGGALAYHREGSSSRVLYNRTEWDELTKLKSDALTLIAKTLERRREKTWEIIKWSVPVFISTFALIVSLSR